MKTQSTPNPYNICTFATISTNIRRNPVALNLPYEPTGEEVQDQIGDLYQIPSAVLIEGARLASARNYVWPEALRRLADNVIDGDALPRINAEELFSSYSAVEVVVCCWD